VILARRAGAPRGARSADPRRRSFWALAIPPALALALFLVAPGVFMGALSFREDLAGTLLAPFEPTLKHYAQFFATPSFMRSLGLSALTAFGVAVLATVLAYPLAYFLAFRAGRRAAVYLILLLVPFWTSYLLRVMAWKLMLGGEGVINSVLIWAGVVTEPISALLYNRGAVIVTLVYVWIPFAALPILAALGRVKYGADYALASRYVTFSIWLTILVTKPSPTPAPAQRSATWSRRSIACSILWRRATASPGRCAT